jgi:hypothetical protein
VNISTQNSDINYDVYVGGCFSFHNVSLLKISLCTFRLCSTSHFGGGIFVYNGNNGEVDVEKSLFIECFSQYYGGSLMFYRVGDVLINSCSFLHSYGDDFGGAVSTYYSVNVSVTNCSFFNCTSNGTFDIPLAGYGWGGALYLGYPTYSNFSNCSFGSCFARLWGVILSFL